MSIKTWKELLCVSSLPPPEKKKSACVLSEINRHGLDIKRKVKEAIHAARQGLGIQRFCSRQSALKLWELTRAGFHHLSNTDVIASGISLPVKSFFYLFIFFIFDHFFYIRQIQLCSRFFHLIGHCFSLTSSGTIYNISITFVMNTYHVTTITKRSSVAL